MSIITKALEWKTIDRVFNEWPSGPWDDEPDKAQWQDQATGFACLAVRSSHSGHWCGYVGVPQSHPTFGKNYDDVDVQVHGGLTFSAQCNDHSRSHWKEWREKISLEKFAEEARQYPKGDSARWIRTWAPCLDNYDLFVSQCQASAICHITDSSEDVIWWLGFDCAHSGDLSPSDYQRPDYVQKVSTAPWPTSYKSLAYVKNECSKLASQLAQMVV